MYQFLKTILLSISLLGGSDPAGRHASKASLWGITKTMLGMIALAARVVRVMDSIFLHLFESRYH